MANIRFRGCAEFSYSDRVFIQFAEGSTVFARHKANVGVLEKVVIKTYKIIKSHKTWGQYVVQFFDTHNRIWFANELVEEEDALALAESYYERRIAAISALECPPT